MAQDADELKEGIARTRAELSGTVAAIEDRVRPSRMVERRVERVKDGARSLRQRVMGAVDAVEERAVDAKDHARDMAHQLPSTAKERTGGAPLVAGAVAFGVGFLAAVVFPPTRRERAIGPKVLEQVEPVKEEIAGRAEELAEQVSATIGEHTPG